MAQLVSFIKTSLRTAWCPQVTETVAPGQWKPRPMKEGLIQDWPGVMLAADLSEANSVEIYWEKNMPRSSEF